MAPDYSIENQLNTSTHPVRTEANSVRLALSTGSAAAGAGASGTGAIAGVFGCSATSLFVFALNADTLFAPPAGPPPPLARDLPFFARHFRDLRISIAGRTTRHSTRNTVHPWKLPPQPPI